jgi:hypothetical protein
MGITFPGDLTYGTPFASLSHLPHEAWDSVPYAGKVQMLVAIGLVEFLSEVKKVTRKRGLAGKELCCLRFYRLVF